ncbi:hypothetical protein SALBM135S_08803 [Streptomyces alboniger]
MVTWRCRLTLHCHGSRSGGVLQVPLHAITARLTAERPSVPTFPRHPRDLVGEGRELVRG